MPFLLLIIFYPSSYHFSFFFCLYYPFFDNTAIYCTFAIVKLQCCCSTSISFSYSLTLYSDIHTYSRLFIQIILHIDFYVRCCRMISYEPLFKTMKEKGITSYRLQKEGFSRATYYSIKQGNSISTNTINQLCKLLKCKVSDVLEYIEE